MLKRARSRAHVQLPNMGNPSITMSLWTTTAMQSLNAIGHAVPKIRKRVVTCHVQLPRIDEIRLTPSGDGSLPTYKVWPGSVQPFRRCKLRCIITQYTHGAPGLPRSPFGPGYPWDPVTVHGGGLKLKTALCPHPPFPIILITCIAKPMTSSRVCLPVTSS